MLCNFFALLQICFYPLPAFLILLVTTNEQSFFMQHTVRGDTSPGAELPLLKRLVK